MGFGAVHADTPDAQLELLARAPGPEAAAKLTAAQISTALKRARRHDVPARTQVIKDGLRAQQLTQPAVITAAYAAAVQATAAHAEPLAPRLLRARMESTSSSCGA